jgi:U3 small nucleolar RNA-associated protein 23
MRINRGKAIRKHLRFYRIVYGFDAPYNFILDGNFIYEATKYKMDILHRLTQQLQVKTGEINLFITSSSLAELASVKGENAVNATNYAKAFCEVLDDSDGHGEASFKLVQYLEKAHQRWVKATGTKDNENVKRFMVATQDKVLRHNLARLPGIPLVYLNNVALVMEVPSSTSREFNSEIEQNKAHAITETEKTIANMVSRKRKHDGEDNENNVVGAGAISENVILQRGREKIQRVDRVKHKAKSANPLASRAPTKNSSNQKKKDANKFRK